MSLTIERLYAFNTEISSNPFNNARQTVNPTKKFHLILHLTSGEGAVTGQSPGIEWAVENPA
jgi:hypothetical protein